MRSLVTYSLIGLLNTFKNLEMTKGGQDEGSSLKDCGMFACNSSIAELQENKCIGFMNALLHLKQIDGLPGIFNMMTLIFKIQNEKLK